MHPGAVGGIERNVTDPQQRLAVPGFGNRGLGQLEMFRPEFARGFFNQKDLPVGGAGHVQFPRTFDAY